MLLLLPPSETKRDGGDESRTLDLAALSYLELTPQRRAVIAATRRLARNLSTMASALKLGPSQQFELIRNRTLGRSPVMPALERYTGVLYDALDISTLGPGARAFAGSTVVIHSALFGLLGAHDPIPAYRLSHDSRLPGLSLKKTWRDPIASVLARPDGLVLDLRSEAYAQLGPAPGASPIRVVAIGADGQRRALNHFNKRGKGLLVRAMLSAGIDHPHVDSLIAWAAGSGIDLARGRDGQLELLVPEEVAGGASGA